MPFTAIATPPPPTCLIKAILKRFVEWVEEWTVGFWTLGNIMILFI